MNNYWERFSSVVDSFGDSPAIIVQRRNSVDEVDYRALRAQAEDFAVQLAQLGIAQGDRCAIVGENSPGWCAAYLGILRLGAIAVPIDRNYKPTELADILSDSGSAVLFSSASCVPIAEAAQRLSNRPLHLVALDAGSDPQKRADRKAPSILPPCPSRLEDPAVILYTSGTTSDPKGVVLTHGNLLAEVDGVVAALPLRREDCSLGALPLFHSLSQVTALLLPFSGGGRVVMMEEVNASEVLRAMQERGITILCIVPQFFYLIHERITQELAQRSRFVQTIVASLIAANGFARERLNINFGRLVFRKIHALCGRQIRFFVSTGAAFDPEIERSLYNLGFDVLQAYGLTESSAAATITPLGGIRIGTVGKPIPGVSMAVLAPDGKACEVGQEGEVALRGPTLTPGYYRRPDATAAAFHDGWFWTGDLGLIDKDGYLRITGRSKEVIVLGSGKNIYPEEIERHLQRSPFIKEVCVVGRQLRGNAMSEVLYAAVVPDMAALRERRIVNIREFIRNEIETLSAQLPPSKRVMGFELMRTDLPRTTTRKLKRFLIQQQLQGGDASGLDAPAPARTWSAEDKSWAEAPNVATVLNVIRAQAPAKPAVVHPDDSLELDLGFDSLRRIELIVALEQALGAKLRENAAIDCYTVRDLAGALSDPPGESGCGRSAPTSTMAWPKLIDEGLSAAGGAKEALPRGVGPVLQAVRFCMLRAIRLTGRLLLHLDVRGIEHLPADGAFVLAANHQSYLDAFLLLSALPYRLVRRTVILGKTRVLRKAVMRYFAERLNVAAIDADANLVQAMRVSACALHEGKVLLLFPEGERSIDGEIKPVRRGAAILSCHLGVPIVPAIIEGTYDVWPRGRAIQRLAPVSIRFLPPLAPPQVDHSDDGSTFDDRAAQLTAELQRRMEAALSQLRSRAN